MKRTEGASAVARVCNLSGGEGAARPSGGGRAKRQVWLGLHLRVSAHLRYVRGTGRRSLSLVFFFCIRPALSSDKALGFATRSLHQCCRAQYSHPW